VSSSCGAGLHGFVDRGDDVLCLLHRQCSSSLRGRATGYEHSRARLPRPTCASAQALRILTRHRATPSPVDVHTYREERSGICDSRVAPVGSLVRPLRPPLTRRAAPAAIEHLPPAGVTSSTCLASETREIRVGSEVSVRRLSGACPLTAAADSNMYFGSYSPSRPRALFSTAQLALTRARPAIVSNIRCFPRAAALKEVSTTITSRDFARP